METKPQHSILMKVFGSINVLFALIIVGLVGMGAYFGNKVVQTQVELRASQEMVLSNLRIMNEQTVVSEILKEKLGDKLSIDQLTKLAFVIVDGCRKNNVPVYLVMGLIEQESTWNPKALSSMGAIGLMQVMPDTAVRIYKQRGLTFTLESLYDPVLNVSIGIDVLLDKQEAAIAQGKATKDDWIYALYYYCGKGDTYAREVIVRSVAYRKRLETPVQELLKRAQDQDRLASLAEAAIKDKKLVAK
jgi:hypothetical protein